MKMVRGEHLVDAIWARDKSTLWNALKRLMVPLYLQSGKIAIGIFFAIVFLLFIPFPILATSIALPTETTSSKILCHYICNCFSFDIHWSNNRSKSRFKIKTGICNICTTWKFGSSSRIS